MAPKAVKAGPVATGTDLRKSDLVINSDISHSARAIKWPARPGPQPTGEGRS